MKKMVTYLVTLGMMLSMIPAAAASAETAATASIVASTDTSTTFYEEKNPPVTSISVASIAGTWTDAATFEKLEVRTVKAEPKFTSTELVAVSKDGADGYAFYLNAAGNYAYWEADFNMTSAGEKLSFSTSSKQLTDEKPYVTAGSTVTALSAVVTPYSSDGKAGKPITVVWDRSNVLKNVTIPTPSYSEVELYKGEFTFTDKDGKKTEGTIKFEYSLNSDYSKSYWYTFYDNDGKLWNAFAATGEIQLDYIAAGKEGKPYFMHYLFGGAVSTNTGSLNFRKEPSTSSTIYGLIPEGTQLNIFDSGVEGWYKTEYNGMYGYVSADYIKKIEDYVPQTNDIIDIKELTGKWRYEIGDGNYTVDISSKYNGVFDIKENGTFMYIGADGKFKSGKITFSEEKFPDGTKAAIVKFSNGTNFEVSGYYDGKNGISVGNGGMERIVRNEGNKEGLDSLAVERIDNYLKIDGIICGSLNRETEAAFKEGEISFFKVTDTNYKSIADIKAFINENTTGSLNKELLGYCDEHFREKDGVLYEIGGGKGSVGTDTGKGVIITDKTDKSYKATTIAPNGIYASGHTRATLEADGDTWKISSIEYDSFDINNSMQDLAWCAEMRASSLMYYMKSLAEGENEYEKEKVKINGVEYVKTADQHNTPDALKDTIKKICTGDLREKMLAVVDDRMIEKDGIVYRKAAPGQTSPDFNLEDGMKILKIDDKGYKAITVKNSQRDGYLSLELVKEGDRFLAKNYDFCSLCEDKLFNGYVDIDSETLNLRSEANTTSKILAGLEKGTQLEIYSSGITGWYKTVYEGKTGYVSAEFISKSPDVIPVVTTSATTTATTAATTTTTAASTTDSGSTTTTNAKPEGRDDAKTASEKMKDLNLIWAILGTNSTTLTDDGYAKVASETVKSVADFKALVTRTCTGDVKDDLLKMTENMTEKNGVLYIKPSNSAFYQFQLGKGVTVVDPAMDAFTAIANDGDELYGTGKVTFRKDGDNWLISKYEFGDFKAETKPTTGDLNDDGEIDLKDVVLLRRYIAGGWGVKLDEKKADVNGDNELDLKDVVILRRYIAGGWGVTLK